MHKRLLYILLPILCVACKPDTGCRTTIDVRSTISVEWLHVDTLGKGQKMTVWDAVSVQGTGAGMLYTDARNQKTLRLPLRQDTCLTEYEITWHDKTDRLYIQHQNNRTYLSMACGCAIYHLIDSVWSDRVFIQRAEILNTTVENYEQENIKLYLEE